VIVVSDEEAESNFDLQVDPDYGYAESIMIMRINLSASRNGKRGGDRPAISSIFQGMSNHALKIVVY
jgi:hypothetical protein